MSDALADAMRYECPHLDITARVLGTDLLIGARYNELSIPMDKVIDVLAWLTEVVTGREDAQPFGA